MSASPVPPERESPAPYPSPHEFEAALGEALAARDIDRMLAAVRRFAEDNPPPRGHQFHAPAQGLLAGFEGQVGPPLPREQATSWFHMLLYNAGNVALRAEEPLLAIELYKQSLLGHRHPSIFNNIGAALKRLLRMEEALIWYLRAIQEDPGYAIGYLRAAALAGAHALPGADPQEYLRRFQAHGGTAQQLAQYLAGCGPEEAAALMRLLEAEPAP